MSGASSPGTIEDEAADPLYRPAVGIMLVNARGEVFVGQRRDMPPGMAAWQMPQGGIDPGETPEIAALREMKEEVGTDRAEIIASSSRWLSYDLPAEIAGRVWGGRFRGQKQKWFVLRFLGTDADIDIATAHPEFDAWQWVPADRLVALIVPFKRALYEQVLSDLGSYCTAAPPPA